MNPNGTTARSATAGMSSTPTCTPAAPDASATSARSFTITGTGTASTSARDLHELARIDVLETQLHHGCAAADRSRGAAHEAIGAVAEVIRDRDETENVGNRKSGIGNRQTRSREREQGTEAACYVRDVPAKLLFARSGATTLPTP